MIKKISSCLIFSGMLISFFPVGQASQTNPKVLMKTSKGEIKIELFADKAPLTVSNFLSYVDEKFYEGTIFHRVIKGFMIQGGGLTADLQEKQTTKPPIQNEATNRLSNKRGTIAMARTMEINSATCQFFINHVDNPFLDHRTNTPEGFGYAVFGRVIEGMDVVDAIANLKTTRKRGYEDVPVETVTIISITRVEEN